MQKNVYFPFLVHLVASCNVYDIFDNALCPVSLHKRTFILNRVLVCCFIVLVPGRNVALTSI